MGIHGDSPPLAFSESPRFFRRVYHRLTTAGLFGDHLIYDNQSINLHHFIFHCLIISIDQSPSLHIRLLDHVIDEAYVWN